jgi:hypothetical protein
MSYTDSFGATPGTSRYTGGGQWFQPSGPQQTVITNPRVTSRAVYASMSDEPSWIRWKPGAMAGALSGVLSTALAVGVATLVAAFVRPQASPLIAVGVPFIARTPQSVMNFAMMHFGTQDNLILVAGTAAVIAVVGIVIGVLGIKRPAAGVTGMALLALSGAFVVITRPGSVAMDAMPSVIGGVAGVIALMWLIRTAYRGSRA